MERTGPLTPLERFRRTVRFAPVDRVPYWELGFWGQAIERWLAEGMPPAAAQEDVWRGSEFFRTDRRDFIPLGIWPLPPFEQQVIEENERTVTYVDDWGITRRAMKEGTVRGTRPSMDQHVRFPVGGPDDFAALRRRFRLDTAGRYPDNWEESVCRWKERDYPLCLLTNATFGLYSMLRRWMGTEGLSYAWYDQPTLVHEMLDFLVEFFTGLTRPALQALEVDYFNFFEDMAYKSGPLVSPALQIWDRRNRDDVRDERRSLCRAGRGNRSRDDTGTRKARGRSRIPDD